MEVIAPIKYYWTKWWENIIPQ